MFGHNLAGAVKSARVDLVLQDRHTGDGFVIRDCNTVGGNAGGRRLDATQLAKLLLDALIIEHGQHAAHIKSGCFHALLLSFRSASANVHLGETLRFFASCAPLGVLVPQQQQD
jgi:hypothetical protein